MLRWVCIQPAAMVPPLSFGTANSTLRQTSPSLGRSMWITSAPISAAIPAAKGWAIIVPLEMIRTPCRGPNCSERIGGRSDCIPPSVSREPESLLRRDIIKHNCNSRTMYSADCEPQAEVVASDGHSTWDCCMCLRNTRFMSTW